MKKVFVLLFAVCATACADKKSETADLSENSISEKIKSPSEFFPKEKTKVLVVGTFHFDYPGLDDHKTAEDDKVDVLKEPKKSEVTELVEYIKRFQPTKIAIEAFPSWKAHEKFKKYLNGEYGDERDERYQLGMRIAKELSLDTLYPVNATALRRDLYKTDTITLNRLIGDVDWEREEPYDAYMEAWFEHDDKLVPQIPLLDYFKYMNSEESHDYGYGIYLLGGFKSENNQGADNLSIWWYNRNLRIFRNVQGITEGPEDRILIIIGNGHGSILRQLFTASPEYEFIEFSSL